MNAMRRVFALVLAAALATGFAGAPATAAGIPGQAASSATCAPEGQDVASTARGATAGAAGRDGTIREPGLDQPHEDLPASAKGRAGANFAATVPVYFHVITDGPIGSLTATQIDDQLTVLNETFAGREGGARTGFSFRLAGVTRTDNADWFAAGPGGTNEKSMKAALHQGSSDALNVYTTTAGPYLGWAYLPEILTKPGQAYLDGIVLDWESLPGVSTRYAGRYDLGETLTHETGHWVNLEHTFYGGCNAKGDFVHDTPPEKEPTSGCPADKDTCTAPGLDPIHNYMDYSYDSCYTMFTAGQAQRMRDAWLLYRAP